MINEETIKKDIERSSPSKYFLAVDNHPLGLLIGKNEDGYPTLRFNGSFLRKEIIGTEIMEIKQLQFNELNSLLFIYKDLENISLFVSFCLDMINTSFDIDKENGYCFLIKRYKEWKMMFKTKGRKISDKEIQGLIGELLFLWKYAMPIFGEQDAIKGWGGIDHQKKDFSINQTRFEVKTTNLSKDTVTISSVDQLLSEKIGFLVVYYLERRAPAYDGIKLNALVSQISKSIKSYDVKLDFMQKLSDFGYEKNVDYDYFVFEMQGYVIYKINNAFPRINKDMLKQGIINVKYDLYLGDLKEFKIRELWNN